MFHKTIIVVSLGLLAATGCTAQEADQTLSGHVAASTFPEPVTRVDAIGAGGSISAAVTADGSFTLQLPPGDRYRIELVSATHRSLLVYPRGGTAYDTSVYIAGEGAFGLGEVQHVALDTGAGGGQDGATPSNTPDDNLGGGQDGSGATGPADTGSGGGQDTSGAGPDPGTGGGNDTGTGGGGN